MNSLLPQIVALTTSALLTLPAGWCSGTGCAVPSEPIAALPACCHAGEHAPPGESQQPSQPDRSGDCCCSWEATVPQHTQPTDSTIAFSFPHNAAQPNLESSQLLLDRAKESPVRSGPRLHVMHCIWRC